MVPDTSTTDAFFQAHQLLCSAPVNTADAITPTALFAQFDGKTGSGGSAQLTPGETTVLGSFRNDALPLKISLNVIYPREVTVNELSQSRFETASASGLHRRFEFKSLDVATEAHKALIAAPFGLAKVTLRNASGQRAIVTVKPYKLTLLPYSRDGENGPEEVTLTASAQASGVAGASVDLLLAAKEGPYKLTVRGLSSAALEVDVSAPGEYELTSGGVKKVDDVAGDGGVDPGVDGGIDPISPEAGVLPALDAATTPPTDPDPTCGGGDQRCCGGNGGGFNGTCDPGGYCGPSGKCLACGDADQLCCGKTGGSSYDGTCNSGAYCGSGGKCLACGKADQLCCGTSGGSSYNGTCETGSFCGSGGKCLACGAPDQLCCGTAGGSSYNGSCNSEGFCGSGGKCIACGDQGEACCGATGGSSYNGKCNGSLKCNGSGKCQ
jgi:hypothetical protein